MKKQIRLRNGKTITVDRIKDYIDDDGRQYSLAWKGNKCYKVIDRDFAGAVWGEDK